MFKAILPSRVLYAALFATTLVSIPVASHAQKVDEPSLRVFDIWAKTTVPGGRVSAAYMHVKSAKPLRLVKAESSVAETVEIHDMKMKDGVMEMKAVDAIDIPANKLVDLKPGGLHIMLVKVKAPILKEAKVPLTLTFETADKKTFTREVFAMGKEKDDRPHKH